jgi:hypothetical protein
MDRPEDFGARLRRLADTYRPGLFHFTDNAIPPAILRHLAAGGSPAPWYGFVRAEPALTDPAFVDALARSGCVMLQLGLETPDHELLNRMQKGVDPRHFGAILRNLRASGIASYVYLLFGLPGQTLEKCEQVLAFLDENPVDFLNASVFRLPPDAAIAETPDRFDVTCLSDMRSTDLYHAFEAGGTDRLTLRRWLSRRFYRHPAVRHAVARTPRYFKSNHAVHFARRFTDDSGQRNRSAARPR